MSDSVVFYVCTKCKRKILSFHLVTDGRIVCYPCDAERRKFIEQFKPYCAPKVGAS